MGKFDDVLGMLHPADGEPLVPDDVLSQLRAAYDEDMSIPNAKIAQMQTTVAETQAQLQAQKAANWDVLQNGGEIPHTTTSAVNSVANQNAEQVEYHSILDLFGGN